MNKNKLKYLLAYIALLFSIINLNAQKNHAYTFPDKEFKSANELFATGQYTAAKEAFSIVYKAIPNKYDLRKEQSLYHMGICAALMFHADAEKIILSFIEDYPENLHLDKLWFYLGNYYFANNAYRKALNAYENIADQSINSEYIAEYEFKKGYSYFIAEKYNEAKLLLSKAKERESQYQMKALFYYSHILYLEKNYNTALLNFQKLKDIEGYSNIIPFYISHIYFALEEYEDIIMQAPELLAKSSQKRLGEMNRIIAQSHFQLKQYEKAIPYFETYLEKANALTCDDFYEIGICYYKTNKYNKAIDYLTKSFCKDNDSINQYIYYALGDCYIQTKQKEFASNAFLSAYESKKNPIITEDGLYNYAKLQYELSSNPFLPTITAFENFLNEFPNSTYRNEAEQFLSNIYLTTKNYKAAITSLEKIKQKSITLLKAYQRVLYFRGAEFYNDNKLTEAADYFDKTIENNYNPIYYAKSLFWKGEIDYSQKKYDEAIKNYNLFFASNTASSIEEYPMAFYNLGYAHFENQQYSLALKNFLTFEELNKNQFDNKILIDATNRIGDCYFMTSNLSKAIAYYDKTIDYNSYDIDYALYQKAMAQGGIRLYDSKITTLEQLISTYANSNYLLEAENEIANTYLMIGNNKKAEELYVEIINKNNENANLKAAMLKLGLIYFNTEQDEKALNMFKQIVKKYPKSDEASIALKNIETIYSASGNIEDFFVYVKNVSFANITAEHQDTIMYNAAAEKYFNKNFEDANKGFMTYIERFPKGVFATHAHFYIAEIAMRKSNDNVALTNYEYVIQNPLDQFELIAIQNAADLYYKKQNYNQSLNYYTLLSKKTNQPSQKTDATLGIIRTSFYNKNYNNAITLAENFIKEPKLNPDVQQEIHIIIARSAMELNDLKKALLEYEYIAKISKSEYASEALYNIAYITYKQDNLVTAEKKIFTILTNISHDYWLAKSYILLGDIYLAKGNSFQAKHTYLSIIENYDGQDLKQIAQEKYNAIVEKEEAIEQYNQEEKLKEEKDNTSEIK